MTVKLLACIDTAQYLQISTQAILSPKLKININDRRQGPVSSHAIRVWNGIIKENTMPPSIFSLCWSASHNLWSHCVCWLPSNTSASHTLHWSTKAFSDIPSAADWKHPLGNPQKTWLWHVVDTSLAITGCQICTAQCSVWRLLWHPSNEWISIECTDEKGGAQVTHNTFTMSWTTGDTQEDKTHCLHYWIQPETVNTN